MVSHNYIKASKAAAAVITILLLIVGGGDVYSARAINYSSSSKQLRHRRQDTPAAKKTATATHTTHERRGLNSLYNDGYDTNSIFKTERDTKCTRSITKDDGSCIMKCQTTTFVYNHDDILLDKTVSENDVRKCTYDEEKIMALESDEGSTRVDDDWRDGGGNDDSWKCSPRKRTWQVRKMRERERAGVGGCFCSSIFLCFKAIFSELRTQLSLGRG